MNAPQRRKEWREFKKWCADRRLKALPAHPWTLSAYALWLDANRRHRTLQKRLDVIARVHIRALTHSPERDPLVLRTLEAIETRRGNKDHKIFTGQDLFEPKKKAPCLSPAKERRRLSHTPPLVEKRLQRDLENH